MRQFSVLKFLGISGVLHRDPNGEGRWLNLPTERTQRHMVASGRTGADGWIYQSLLRGGPAGDRGRLSRFD